MEKPNLLIIENYGDPESEFYLGLKDSSKLASLKTFPESPEPKSQLTQLRTRCAFVALEKEKLIRDLVLWEKDFEELSKNYDETKANLLSRVRQALSNKYFKLKRYEEHNLELERQALGNLLVQQAPLKSFRSTFIQNKFQLCLSHHSKSLNKLIQECDLVGFR